MTHNNNILNDNRLSDRWSWYSTNMLHS